jgi:hypothetical protein
MENIRHSTQGLGQALLGFAILVLMLVGLSGTIYKMLAPGGWIAQLFGRSITAGMAVLAALGFIGLIAWFSREYSSPMSRNRFSDLFVYGFTAAGFVYAVRFWMSGVF